MSLLTGLNFLNYLDRLIMAAVLPAVIKDLQLSNFEGGLLATIFLLGYFATSPLFGVLGDRMPRKQLIAAGVLTWSFATVASGLSGSLLTLVIARAFVGVGEASYATLAPTIIDDITPPDRKGRMLSIFYAAMPLGAAAGILLGGFIHKHWGWRTAFFVGGGPGILLSLVCLAIDEPTRKLAAARDKIADLPKQLARIPLYRRTLLGYCAHTAAVGAFSYWGPTFLSREFAAELAPADPTLVGDALDKAILFNAALWFGVVTVICGFVGTLLGGRLNDRIARAIPVPADADHLHPENLRAANAQLKLCAIGMAIAFPLTVAAFVVPSLIALFVLVGLAQMAIFMLATPINAILLRSVPVAWRASAMAVAIFTIHLFGDLWSPSLVGELMDVMRPAAAMMALPSAFAIAAAVWWPRLAARREL